MCWLKETPDATGVGLAAMAGAAINSKHAATIRIPEDRTVPLSGIRPLPGNLVNWTD